MPPALEKEATIKTVKVPRRRHYEYKSKSHIGGLPLIHINIGWYDRRFKTNFKARGIIAVGNIATGLISIGLISVGIFSFGALSFGLLVLGGLALGLALACGGVALGIFALGGLAVGMFASGGCAIASHIAVGGYARGHIACGEITSGARIAERYIGGSGKVIDSEMMVLAIKQEFTEMWLRFRELLIKLYGGW